MKPLTLLDLIQDIEPHEDIQGMPVRNLAAAVLQRGILDAMGTVTIGGERSQKSIREAKKWMQSNDTDHPFSYVSCCLILELDPENIRYYTFNR